MNSASYGRLITRTGNRFEGCTISQQDWQLIIRGHEIEKEKSCRNLSLGIAASSGFGTLSTVVSHFDEIFSAGLPLLESTFLVLMLSATLSAGALTVFFHRRIGEGAPDRAIDRLDESMRDQLEHPDDPDDPRQWP